MLAIFAVPWKKKAKGTKEQKLVRFLILSDPKIASVVGEKDMQEQKDHRDGRNEIQLAQTEWDTRCEASTAKLHQVNQYLLKCDHEPGNIDFALRVYLHSSSKSAIFIHSSTSSGWCSSLIPSLNEDHRPRYLLCCCFLQFRIQPWFGGEWDGREQS